MVLGGLLQLLQDQRRNLRRRVQLALRLNGHVVALLDHLVGHHLHLVADFVEAAPHKPLDGVNSVSRVGDRLPLGHLAHQPLPGLGKRHHGRRRPSALFVGDHFGLAALHHRDDRVRRPQIDADHLCHGNFRS
jgi:hypothetical protein